MGLVLDSWLWEAIAVLTVVFTVAYLYATRHFSYWAKRGVPYIKPIPFLGNVKDLFLLKFSLGGFCMDVYKKMPGKPYVGFFILDRPALVIRDPDLIKKVLVKDFNYFADRHVNSDVHVDPLGHKNLFVIKGQLWKYLRTKLSPTFTSGRMKKMFSLVANCDKQMVDHLEGLTNKNPTKTIDIKEIAAKCTTDVISTCAFGIASNTLQDPNAEFREFGKKTFEYNIARALEVIVFFFVPSFVKLANLSFFQKDASNFLRKVFWDTIDQREKSKTKRNDLVDFLIELKNKGSIDVEEKDKAEVEHYDHDASTVQKFDFSGDDLVAQAALFFVAGFETSASTMSFALYELALQPKLQERLRNEIADALKDNGGNITYELVFGLKYLDMVISETLRKYPTLPFLDRVCLKDYHIPETGLTIEKGTPIFIPLQGIQTDPQYYPNPERFDPERFNEEGKKSRVPFTYMPFGEGPHNCIGMRFGLMSAKAGVLHILTKFVVEASEDTPVPLQMNTRGVVTTPKGGVPLRFIKSPLL
ncbi:cytochrome P450 6k1 [Anabrus simplex]|uniref:cytochrome P450 6k1 n=1 Tax=Anabrus simplex TaxID=316456 RepID=UPI0035A3387E